MIRPAGWGNISADHRTQRAAKGRNFCRVTPAEADPGLMAIKGRGQVRLARIMDVGREEGHAESWSFELFVKMQENAQTPIYNYDWPLLWTSE